MRAPMAMKSKPRKFKNVGLWRPFPETKPTVIGNYLAWWNGSPAVLWWDQHWYVGGQVTLWAEIITP